MHNICQKMLFFFSILTFIGYLVAGIAGNGWIGVVAGFVLLAIAMTYIYKVLMKD